VSQSLTVQLLHVTVSVISFYVIQVHMWVQYKHGESTVCPEFCPDDGYEVSYKVPQPLILSLPPQT